MIRKYWLLILCALVSGCATFDNGQLHAEGALASGLCVKGGYAMAGGVVVGAKVNDGFVGKVKVDPDCAIEIESVSK